MKLLLVVSCFVLIFLKVSESKTVKSPTKELTNKDCMALKDEKDIKQCLLNNNDKRPSRMKPSNGGVINGKSLKSKCVGSMKIFHRHKYNKSKTGSFFAKKSSNRSLKSKLKRKLVYKINVQGICCWKINSRTRGRGQSQILKPGFSGPPDFQLMSYRKVSCT